MPLLHGTNRLVGWISSHEGVKPFIENAPEHPRVNYQSTPIRGLYDLQRLIGALDECLPAIDVPALAIYADHDPVVSVKSAQILMDRLGGTDKRLRIIPASRHGILMENTAGTWQIIDDFLREARAFPLVGGKHGPCFNPAVPSNEKIRCE